MPDVTYTAGGGRGHRALPTDLLNPKCWLVPQPDRLLHLLCSPGGPRGLAQWAGEIVAAHDQVAALSAHVNLAELDAAAQHARRHFHTPRATYGPTLSPAEITAERRARQKALLRPLQAAGLTMRQIASYTDLAERDIVAALFNPRCAPNASRYCDAEQAIRAGMLDDQSRGQVARMFQITVAAVTRIAEMSGVAYPIRKGGRPRVENSSAA